MRKLLSWLADLSPLFSLLSGLCAMIPSFSFFAGPVGFSSPISQFASEDSFFFASETQPPLKNAESVSHWIKSFSHSLLTFPFFLGTSYLSSHGPGDLFRCDLFSWHLFGGRPISSIRKKRVPVFLTQRSFFFFFARISNGVQVFVLTPPSWPFSSVGALGRRGSVPTSVWIRQCFEDWSGIFPFSLFGMAKLFLQRSALLPSPSLFEFRPKPSFFSDCLNPSGFEPGLQSYRLGIPLLSLLLWGSAGNEQSGAGLCLVFI